MRRKNINFSNMAKAAKRSHRFIASLLALALLSFVLLASTGLAADVPGRSITSSPTTSVVASEPSSATTSPVSADSTLGVPVAVSDTSAPTPVQAEGVTVTVSPDTTRSIAPGNRISYTFRITNEASAAGLFDLAATGTAGFVTKLTTVQGASVASLTIEAGETTQVVATLAVPKSADVGSMDQTTFTATLDTSAGVTAEADVTTKILDGLMFIPDHTFMAGPGDVVTYRHAVINSWPETRTVGLWSADASGWPVAFFAADGVTQITSVTVGPYGDSQEVLARLSVPRDVTAPATDTLDLTAAVGTMTADAIDTTVVRRLATYSDAALTAHASAFRLTDVVYAKATGLDESATVHFVWRDQDGNAIRTSATSTVDASGTASDLYSTLDTDTVGAWSVDLYSDGTTETLIESCPFSLTFKAQITGVSATDGRNVDSTIAVSSAVQNMNSREITGTTMSYLIWWDGNGDGIYNDGDTYIDANGDPQDYSVDATSHVTPVASVPATGTWTEASPWSMSNSRFPNQGTYRVTATWRDANGTVIDQKTGEFFAVPALGWPLLLLLVGTIGVVMSRQLPLPEKAGLHRDPPWFRSRPPS